jgi:Na+/glutamate symporter
MFATLAGGALSHQIRDAWRLAAWVISAAVFAAHIGYEHLRLRSAPRTTAFRASLAVALGAFGLAVAAMVHAHARSGHPRSLAFLVWPVVGALPAFGVALAAATVLARTRRGP